MKAVLFDFNGTLYNDTDFHRRAWRSYMKKRFGADVTDAQLDKYYIGPGNETIFKTFFNGKVTDAEIVKYSLEKEEEYRSICRSDPKNLQLIEGAYELFDDLRSREIPFAVATASGINNVNFYLNELGLGKWLTIDDVVYEDGRCRGKPAPDFYLEAARRVKCDIAECIVVEDSRTGLSAAVNAKAGRIIAIDRSTPREELESMPQVYAVIHDYYGFERFL